MNKINQLDSSIYNLISAGEVIERPASVVKELVENAIDAGAKNISIEIVDGGKSKILITDDGCGINSDYVKTAFLPHATSKIIKACDLNNINTLGFRGEALASIASVSMVTMITKTKDADTATKIEIKGGNVELLQESAGVDGTTMIIENLFFNTPARIKFLKRNKTEETKITSLVTNLFLANPNIAFTYKCDNKLVYQTMGKGLENTLHCTYNRDITMNMLEIKNTFGDFSISGYISNPTFSKGNRSWQTFILNGRVIENMTIRTAVEKAYQNFLMKRAFPLYVLNVKMPYNFVDVNVHPNKTDVRFQDNNKVFSFIYHSISNKLLNYNNVKSAPQVEIINDVEVIDNQKNNKNPIEKSNKFNQESLGCDCQNNQNENCINKAINIDAIDAENISNENDINSDNFKNLTEECVKQQEFKNIQNIAEQFDNISDDKIKFHTSHAMRNDSGISYEAMKMRIKNYQSQNFIDNNEEVFHFDGEIIGQIFDTYILIEKGDNIYFIDQHAAHERILYDKLNKQKESYSQPLLVPYVFDTNHAEFEFINNCMNGLNEIGFDITQFGSLSFKVSAVPEVLTGMNLDKFFMEVTKDLASVPSIKNNSILKDKLKQIACKNAIKAGDKLNIDQIKLVLKTFNESEKLPLQCPHGRPAVVKLSKSDIEKWFKRIV